MTEITKIEVQKKDKTRSNIFLDGEFFCGLQNEVVIGKGLKVGNKVDEEKLKDIVFESEKQVAFNKALNLLNTRFKTRHEIKMYLKEKGFDEFVIEDTLEKLTEYKYINDEHYIEAYINSNKDKKSKKVVELELLKKGVSQKSIDKALETFEGENDLILSLYQKYMKNKVHTFENKQKAIKYLIGKGFAFDDIKYVISYEDYE